MPDDSNSPSPEDGRWLQSVALLLTNLGFDLVGPDKAQGEETSHFLVALRAQPTLTHFDPDKIDYWISDGTRGHSAVLDRETKLPLVTDFAWGRITVTDRLGVKNEFLSFGGTLRAQMTSEATVIPRSSANSQVSREQHERQWIVQPWSQIPIRLPCPSTETG